MSKADLTHFDEYRLQTQLKHSILQSYLGAYLAVLGTKHKTIVYIDAFAGRGFYNDSKGTRHDGSPIRALAIVASDKKFHDRVQCIFIERRPDHFGDLEARVNEFLKGTSLPKSPILQNAAFGEVMDGLSGFFNNPSTRLAPTFLFIDPCGVEGVRLRDIVEILARDGCEVFVFFNYDGVNRIVGLAEAKGESDTLRDLFGSQARVDRLIRALDSRSKPDLLPVNRSSRYERLPGRKAQKESLDERSRKAEAAQPRADHRQAA
ncbi:hypothetical protein PHYC_03821 [Phycisphaerales bacterium]|nr:hypothetical protein PHYC_03821 [Phycisphaerales bacterium]